MMRFIYATLIGLVLAGIVHILIVLLVPSFAAKDAWSTLANAGKPWQFYTVAMPGETNAKLPMVDPGFGVAACRYDLREAPLSVEADGEMPFWSVAIFDRQGQNIFSFNDRTAIEKRLSLIVLDAVQLARLRKNSPAGADKAVLVRSDNPQGFVLIRALLPDVSWKPTLERFLSGAKCDKYLALQ